MSCHSKNKSTLCVPKLSQVQLSSQDPWCHRQNRVMKWLLAILICHVRVVIIIIIIRIFSSKLILCYWKRWVSSCWFWLAFHKVGQVDSLLVFRLISHRGCLGFCLCCLSWNSLFTSIQHLAALSAHLCMCRSNPARPQPHKTRARRLQSSGSAALLYLEPALLLL